MPLPVPRCQSAQDFSGQQFRGDFSCFFSIRCAVDVSHELLQFKVMIKKPIDFILFDLVFFGKSQF